MRFKKTVWSPVEIDYLKKHKHDPVNQLVIALAKSQYAIKKKLKELESGSTKATIKGTKQHICRTRIGKRKDCNNLFFRSSWEANIYRLLTHDKSISLIEYEPTTFSFTEFGILKGTVSYTPDFKITYADGSYLWIEVKGGLMKSQDKTKIRRFKKYFPGEFRRLVAVTPGPKSKTTQFFTEIGVKIRWHYPDLNKKYRNIIPHWE